MKASMRIKRGLVKERKFWERWSEWYNGWLTKGCDERENKKDD